MSRWFTADPHFGHRKIIEYCDRPFGDVDEMNEALVANWNAVVGDSDEVWVLGDVALGVPADMLAAHVERLRGVKILVPGNHDRCWTGHSRRKRGSTPEAARRDYYQIGGFARIVDSPGLFTIAGRKVRAHHFPYRIHDEYELKFAAHRPDDDGKWLIHGHNHQQWRQRGRQINVGVDAWDFRPVHEDVIAALIEAGPADLEPLPHS